MFNVLKWEEGTVCLNEGFAMLMSTIEANDNKPELQNTGLFKMIVEVLTTCHTQYT